VYSLSNFVTVIEFIVAELIFLYSFPKREKFYLRYFISVTACIIICSFIPENIPTDDSSLIKIYTFARYMGMFLITVGAMLISFKATFTSILSACAAGYAVQFASSRTVSVIGLFVPAIYLMVPNNWQACVILCELMVFPFTYTLAYFIFGRTVAKKQIYNDKDPAYNILSITMVFTCILFSRFDALLGKTVFSIALCIFMLLVQINLHNIAALREENMAIKQAIQEIGKRYESSKENIDLINIKCHDLKYKLRSFGGYLPQEEMDSMIESINLYEHTYKSGNEVLDTILAEKSLSCQKESIEITFMGDGAELSFMSVGDTYSFFGNAIDNAIEAVKKLEDKEKRSISITVEKKGDIVFVNISNFFNGEINFKDGYPTTSKEALDYHGFGIKSMKLIAEKYKGKLSVNVADDVFSLNVGMLKDC